MVEQFGQIFQDATTGTYNKENKYKTNIHTQLITILTAFLEAKALLLKKVREGKWYYMGIKPSLLLY